MVASKSLADEKYQYYVQLINSPSLTNGKSLADLELYVFTNSLFTGAQGAQGSQGSQGFQGNQGNQGFQGAQGSQGTQGTQGFQGAQGAQG